MLEDPRFALEDSVELRDLVSRHGWVTLVSNASSGQPVVSHLPVIPDPDTSELVILGHVARVDAGYHELGDHDVVVIVQGPHGYVSPSFYEGGPYVPTWNFVVLHLHGRPEILEADDTYSVLAATVEHFESARPDPWQLDTVESYARGLASHVVGFRLRPARVVGKAKLSQDKPVDDFAGVVSALDDDPTHGNPELAAAMRHYVGRP